MKYFKNSHKGIVFLPNSKAASLVSFVVNAIPECIERK